jgi:hypothetical protein
MRGIATIDRQPGSDTIAVWVTSASEGIEVRHVNAVVIDAAADPDAPAKVRSLTRCSGVLVTKGTVLDGLPIEGAPLTESDIANLVAETETHQEAIAMAVTEFKRRTRSASLTAPTFPIGPNASDYVPEDDTASGRALAAANFLAKAWSAWLQTDEQRRRRTSRPKTGETPWIMPEHMNSAQVATFPEAFAARVHEQSMV